jgi:hypothetical protein
MVYFLIAVALMFLALFFSFAVHIGIGAAFFLFGLGVLIYGITQGTKSIVESKAKPGEPTGENSDRRLAGAADGDAGAPVTK